MAHLHLLETEWIHPRIPETLYGDLENECSRFRNYVLDYNGIISFLNRAGLPADAIMQLPLQIQKDAIQAVVLLHDGGTFSWMWI